MKNSARLQANFIITLELYALDQKLTLDSGATRADLLKTMEGHILSVGVYVGLSNQ